MCWVYYEGVMTGVPDFNSIRKILNKTPPNCLQSSILKHSAVLILLVRNSDSYSLILTERTRNMKHHSGEISFPGGRHDPKLDATMKDTALRECEEEIGVRKDSIEILGQLDDVPTMTGYIITPVVGFLTINGTPTFIQSKIEVEQIFTIPISFFLDPESFREQSMQVVGNEFPIFMFDYKNDSKTRTIWGATAHILVDYLRKIHRYNPSQLHGVQRYSMERIEEIVKERRMNSFSKKKEKIHKRDCEGQR